MQEAKVKRGRAKGFIGKRGSVEVKERSTPTKTPVIPKIPLISESAALKRVTDKVSNAIRNADANALIRRAKKQTTKLGRKPRQRDTIYRNANPLQKSKSFGNKLLVN